MIPSCGRQNASAKNGRISHSSLLGHRQPDGTAEGGCENDGADRKDFVHRLCFRCERLEANWMWLLSHLAEEALCLSLIESMSAGCLPWAQTAAASAKWCATGKRLSGGSRG